MIKLTNVRPILDDFYEKYVIIINLDFRAFIFKLVTGAYKVKLYSQIGDILFSQVLNLKLNIKNSYYQGRRVGCCTAASAPP